MSVDIEEPINCSKCEADLKLTIEVHKLDRIVLCHDCYLEFKKEEEGYGQGG